MQTVFKDGTFGSPEDFNEKKMLELLDQESVSYVKVYNKGAEAADIVNLFPKKDPFVMKAIEDLIQKKIDENQDRKDIYDKYFMLTGEKISTGILKCEEYSMPHVEKLPEHMLNINRRHY